MVEVPEARRKAQEAEQDLLKAQLQAATKPTKSMTRLQPTEK